MESIWSQLCHIPQRPPLPGGLHTEVAVIGAGLAGILTAFALQQAGHRVVVLEGGRVAQQGAPDELIASGGLYRHMVELQRQTEDWSLK